MTSKFLPNSDHPKCKWNELINQKTKSNWMNKNQDATTCLPTGDSFQLYKHA